MRPPPPEVIRATIPPPAKTSFYLNPARPGPVAVSPDGLRVAFTAQDGDGEEMLWVRNLSDSRAHALTGTGGAAYPFWSPDSRRLGFFVRSDGSLKKIDVAGGPPVTICDAPNGKGGSWNSSDVIVFAPTADSPLHRVTASSVESQPITQLEAGNHRSHRHPRFLPDGDHFLYFARGPGGNAGSIMVGSLSGGDSRELLSSHNQAELAAGHLLFVRDQTLMAQPFDAGSLELTGEATPLAEEVLTVSGAALAVFSSSTDDVLAYQTGKAEVTTTLEWRDRSGGALGTLGDGASYRTAILSPDGSHAVVEIYDSSTGTPDLWIYEVERDLRTRFTFSDGSDTGAVWAPDGETVYFASDREGTADIYSKSIGGATEAELVYQSEIDTYPSSVSPDGGFLVFTQVGDTSRSDLWMLPLDGSGEPTVLRQTEFSEGWGAVSPDGRWLAFTSNESGDPQVYVTTFPTPGRKWQISREAGVYPQWCRNGGEIVYVDMDGQLFVSGASADGDSLEVGASTPLFSIQPPLIGGAFFSMSPDCQRILVVPTEQQQADTFLNLFVNWPATLAPSR
jgi:Tol biopolymer transport system component